MLMVRKIVLSIVAVLAVSFAALAQNKQVSGTVTNSDGLAVAGATVIVEGTTNGVITDTNGAFNLSAPANGTLVVSFLGYEEAIVPVAGKTSINVVLKTASEKLDEVTVVAFGTKRKQDIVGSVATVKEGLISNSQATSVSAALEGAVAGLQVFTSSGQPGADSSILLRGIGSLSAGNGALIVVDGVPFNGSLSDLNPADIQSITVSKDAVSNSLYGSRAAGGVVMVTTKRGTGDRIQINFTANWGVTSRAYKDYDMVTDPGEFYELSWYGIRNTEWARNGHDLAAANAYASDKLLEELVYNSFKVDACPKCGEVKPLVGTDGKLNPNARLLYDDTFADALFDSSLRQEYQVSAAGGSDKSDYFVSLGYLDNDSYVLGSDYTRLTTRVNLNTQLRKWLRVGANLSYSKTEQNGVMEDVGKASNPFAVARDWAPIYPVHAYDAEGNLKYNANGKPMYDSGMGEHENMFVNPDTGSVKPRPTATNQNVINSMTEDIRKGEAHKLSSRLYAEVKFLKDFTFTANYAYDYGTGYSTVYYSPTIGDGQSFNGRGTKTATTSATTNFNQILAYNKIVGEHNISAKIGHEYYQFKSNYFSGQKTQFFEPLNPELINGGQMESINSYTQHHNIEGYFAMADYNYGSKYYLSAAYRRDGTSRFLQRWGNFWSVGAGWRISKEKWMENAEWVNDLKIRASYGTQGNESMLNYTPYQDLWSVTWDGSQLGYTPSFYGNPDLSWEKQATIDAGIDFRLWNRVSGSIEYFHRKTNDMIFKRPKSIASGREYNWENIGAMLNQGVEFEVTVDLVKTRKVNWSVTLVGSHYDNKLLTLPEENREDGIVTGRFKYMEGRSIFEYYTYKYAGMDANGNAQWHGFEKDDNGDFILDEAGNKKPTITSEYNKAEKFYLGKVATPKLSGGLSTTFKWNGIDVNIATAFQIGGWAYDSEYLGTMGQSFYVGHNRDMWNTFNPETMSGKYPIWNANNSSNSYSQTSDVHLIDASYLSLRNVTIGYSFPKKWMQKLGIGGIRVYVTGDNLALWSKRQGFDPRVSITGSNGDFGGYAPLRVISGGVNLTF